MQDRDLLYIYTIHTDIGSPARPQSGVQVSRPRGSGVQVTRNAPEAEALTFYAHHMLERLRRVKEDSLVQVTNKYRGTETENASVLRRRFSRSS